MTGFAASQARLYGLLHVATRPATHANLKTRSGDPIDIYLLCSALCAASVMASGGTFALITNDACHLRDRCSALGIADLDLIEHQFNWPVPQGVAFYSAHYKLEVIEAFGTGQYGERVGLIDIDAVLCKPLDLSAPADNALIVYDITGVEQASYGSQRIRQDLERVAGRPLPDPRWYGGEFIIGSAATFAALLKEVRSCWPNYVNAIGDLHHIGDEMVVSAAINLAGEAGLPVLNADVEGGVARWWSTRTKAAFPAFGQIENRSLLHLPADKEFLASFPSHPFDGPRFVEAYRKYAARKLWRRRIVNVASQLLGRSRQFVARLD